MSTETARRWRRSQVSQLLLQAAEQLRKAGDKLTTAAEALAALEKAQSKVAEASRQAQHPVLEGGHQAHTGLPAPLRTRISGKATQLEALASDVRAWTITQDEKALAQRAKAKKGADNAPLIVAPRVLSRTQQRRLAKGPPRQVKA